MFFSVNIVLYDEHAWPQIVSVIYDFYIYLYRFSGLYRPVPFILQFLIGTHINKPILRHQIVQLSGASEAVARQMARMIVQLLSRCVSHIRQTSGALGKLKILRIPVGNSPLIVRLV